MDHFIGNVLEHLDKLELAENTIIVFTSDHGEMLGSHGRTGKNVAETEAFFIPLIVRWGSKLAHRIEDDIVNVPDIMPTLLSLTGLEQMIPQEVQGNNLAPLLLEADANYDPAKAALFINPSSRGVYTGKYMFVVNAVDGNFEQAYCYDNEADPYQQHRIPAEELKPDVLRRLKLQLHTQLEQTNDAWFTNQVCAEYFASAHP